MEQAKPLRPERPSPELFLKGVGDNKGTALIRSSPSLPGRWGASGWNSGRQAALKTAVTLLHPLPGRAAGHEISSRRWGRGRQSNPPVTPTVSRAACLIVGGGVGKVGTDAQTEEGGRKGPVRQRHKTLRATGLSSRGVPQQPAREAPSGPLFSQPQAAFFLQSFHHHPKGQAQA